MRSAIAVAFALPLLAAVAGATPLDLGAEQIVQAGGADISVDAYSVPSLVDWDEDGRPDLMVGEGGGLFPGRIRIYLNTGSAAAPAFETFFHVQAEGADLTVPGSG